MAVRRIKIRQKWISREIRRWKKCVGTKKNDRINNHMVHRTMVQFEDPKYHPMIMWYSTGTQCLLWVDATRTRCFLLLWKGKRTALIELCRLLATRNLFLLLLGRLLASRTFCFLLLIHLAKSRCRADNAFQRKFQTKNS